MENRVRLHIGKESQVVLVNKRAARTLRSFQLTTEPILLTTWEWAGNGPQYEDPPANIFSNERYPLRFDIGENVNDLKVILLSRPLSHLLKVEIDLHPDRKTLLRLTLPAPIHQDVIDTLVSLGVEVDMPGEPLK